MARLRTCGQVVAKRLYSIRHQVVIEDDKEKQVRVGQRPAFVEEKRDTVQIQVAREKKLYRLIDKLPLSEDDCQQHRSQLVNNLTGNAGYHHKS